MHAGRQAGMYAGRQAGMYAGRQAGCQERQARREAAPTMEGGDKQGATWRETRKGSRNGEEGKSTTRETNEANEMPMQLWTSIMHATK